MKAFATALTNVLTARQEVAPSNDLVTSINNTKANAKALDALFSSKAFAPVAKPLLNALSISKQADDREYFVAVKVVVKIVNTANAIAKNDPRKLDGYTRTILENLSQLDNLTNKSAMVSLSKAIEYTDDDIKQKLVSRSACSVGTAGTQTSSTRMMLRSLDICEVLKSKRGDALVIKGNERAQMLFDMIKGKGTALTIEAGAPEAKAATPKPAAKPADKKDAKPASTKPATPKAAPVKPATEKKEPAAKAPVKGKKAAPVKAA